MCVSERVVTGILPWVKHEVFYLYMANDERCVGAILEKKDRMEDGDSTDEYGRGKRRDDKDTTIPTKPGAAEKPYRHSDEYDI